MKLSMVKFVYPLKNKENDQINESELIDDEVVLEYFDNEQPVLIYRSDIIFQTMKIELMHEYSIRKRNINYYSDVFLNLIARIENLNKTIFINNLCDGNNSQSEIISESKELVSEYKRYLLNKQL